jgi:glutamate N-acetyltransferase / amino-acid N-acetyltransferase
MSGPNGPFFGERRRREAQDFRWAEPRCFFRSRWVDAPAGVRELDAGTLPDGFRAAGLACGIKPSRRLDIGVIACDDDGATSAALFTRNALVAAAVELSRQADLDRLRAVVVNSGNANVATEEQGREVARAMIAAVAGGLGIEPARVGVASTGVIGVPLDLETVAEGARRAATELSQSGGTAFSEAILTSDRWPKRASLEVALAGGTVRLSAQAKGAGMLSPSFATMLCFVQTDAAIDTSTLGRLLRSAVERSFERVSVDGQLSTNDSVFAIAGGRAGVTVEPGTDDERAFAAALDALLRQLAVEMVADGEGAERVARLVVRGAVEAVDPVARAVANSPLVKCALHGSDPNWGRILQAAGQAVPDADLSQLSLHIEGIHVAGAGGAMPLAESAVKSLAAAMTGPEVDMRLDLATAGEETEIFFCDLGHGYVSFNSEYTT